MFLTLKDGKLSSFYCLEVFDDCSLSIDARNMNLPPLDASRYDDSNELCFIFVRCLDGQLMQFNVHKLEPSNHFWQVGVCAF